METTTKVVQLHREQTTQDRIAGCLLGGAAGDALGAPVEFVSSIEEIRRRYGPDGITDLAEAYGRVGAITDDTQLTLFTAEGLLRGWARFRIRGIAPAFEHTLLNAYHRWLDTQLMAGPCDKHDGWLIRQPQLFARRAPGQTCLSAFAQSRQRPELPALNESKGCGGVMRVAPVGLFMPLISPDEESALAHAFRIGWRSAAWSHGHPTGHLAAGAFAAIIAAIVMGHDLPSAIARAKDELRRHPDHREVLRHIEQAEVLARSGPAAPGQLGQLGDGWVAEEALAMGLYAALTAEGFESALGLAVNHGGDSDSTGAITGNLLGAMWGCTPIPDGWLSQLELREVIEQLARDMSEAIDWRINCWDGRPSAKGAAERYPAH